MLQTVIRTSPASALAAVLCGCLAPALFAVPTTDVVAVTGDAAPDGNGTVDAAFRPILSDAGQVLYTASITGTAGGLTDGQGLYLSGHSGAATRVVRQGQAAPDGNGVFANLLTATLNDVGQVGFRSFLGSTTGGLEDDTGVYFFDPASGLTQVIREGQASPDGNGVFAGVSRIDPVALNNSGQIVTSYFTTQSNFGEDADGLYTYGPTAGLQVFARGLDPAPVPNAEFFRFFKPAINEPGQFAFTATMFSADINFPEPPDRGLFLNDPVNGLSAVALINDPAPDGNGSFSSITTSVALNDVGKVGFNGFIAGASSGLPSEEGLFIADATGTHQVFREGMAVPNGNGVFEDFRSFTLNNAGQIVTLAELDGTTGGTVDDRGLFVGDSSGLITEILRDGQAMPDGNGTLQLYGSPSSIAMNDVGQMVFIASSLDTAAGADDNHTLIYYDPDTGLEVIVREGDAFLGSTITNASLQSTNPTIGDEASPINRKGQFVYGFSLADGRSGVALWSPFLLGDLNDDGVVTNADIAAFVQALTDPSAFATAFPDVDPDLAGDFNDDGVFTNADIAGFVDLLTASPSLASSAGYAELASLAVPEPSSLLMFGLGGLALLRRRRAAHPIHRPATTSPYIQR